jgi:hypothetical protein
MKSDTLRDQQQMESNEEGRAEKTINSMKTNTERRKCFEHREESGNSLLLPTNIKMPHDDSD